MAGLRRALVLFPVGKVFISRDVLEDPTITVSDLVSAFERYLQGDWGIVNSQSGLVNDLALTNGEPIVASYRSETGTKFCMSTEEGRTQVFSEDRDPYFHFNNRMVWRWQVE